MSSPMKPSTPFKVLTLGTLLDTPIPPREHLVMPWLKQGESAMIYAPAGVGKSMFALSLALAVAGGGKFLAWSAPKPRKVLVVDGEMHLDDIKSRAGALLDKLDVDQAQARENLRVFARQWQHPEVKFPDLATEDGRQKVEEMAADCDLLILDNLSTLATLEDENATSSFKDVVKLLMRMKQRNVACVLIHHTGKSKTSYRGSSMLATTFEVIIGLEQLNGQRAATGAAFSTKWEKYRGRKDPAIRAWDAWLDDEGWHHVVSPREELDRMLEELETGQHGSGKELAAALKWDPSKVTRLKKRAMADGLIDSGRWEALLELGRVDATDSDTDDSPDF